MHLIQRLIRRIPGPVAFLLWVAVCMGVVYGLLFWVPEEWSWIKRARFGSGRSLASFRTSVAFLIGGISGFLFFAEIHGPTHQRILFPWFRLGLLGTAFACGSLVPACERITGWTASESPLSFLLWIGLALSWTFVWSWITSKRRRS